MENLFPYFWVRAGVLAKVTARATNGMTGYHGVCCRYEEVVTKEIGWVSADYVNKNLL